MTWFAPLGIGVVEGLIMAGVVAAFALAFRLLEFPDLGLEGSVPLGAATYAALLGRGTPIIWAIATAALVGAATGAATALLHVRFRVNKFLAGIIVVAISYSLTLRVMDGSNVSLLNLPRVFPFARSTFRVPDVALLGALWILLGAGIIGLLGTRAGMQLRAAGSNTTFAAAIGIRVPFAIVCGLAGTNALAALAGVLQADHQGFADASGGQGILILALASLTIGEAVVPQTRFRYHHYVVVAALAGTVVYQIVVAYAVRLGIRPTDLRLATGVLVLLVFVLRSFSGASQLVEPEAEMQS